MGSCQACCADDRTAKPVIAQPSGAFVPAGNDPILSAPLPIGDHSVTVVQGEDQLEPSVEEDVQKDSVLTVEEASTESVARSRASVVRFASPNNESPSKINLLFEAHAKSSKNKDGFVELVSGDLPFTMEELVQTYFGPNESQLWKTALETDKDIVKVFNESWVPEQSGTVYHNLHIDRMESSGSTPVGFSINFLSSTFVGRVKTEKVFEFYPGSNTSRIYIRGSSSGQKYTDLHVMHEIWEFTAEPSSQLRVNCHYALEWKRHSKLAAPTIRRSTKKGIKNWMVLMLNQMKTHILNAKTPSLDHLLKPGSGAKKETTPGTSSSWISSSQTSQPVTMSREQQARNHSAASSVLDLNVADSSHSGSYPKEELPTGNALGTSFQFAMRNLSTSESDFGDSTPRNKLPNPTRAGGGHTGLSSKEIKRIFSKYGIQPLKHRATFGGKFMDGRPHPVYITKNKPRKVTLSAFGAEHWNVGVKTLKKKVRKAKICFNLVNEAPSVVLVDVEAGLTIEDQNARIEQINTISHNLHKDRFEESGTLLKVAIQDMSSAAVIELDRNDSNCFFARVTQSGPLHI